MLDHTVEKSLKKMLKKARKLVYTRIFFCPLRQSRWMSEIRAYIAMRGLKDAFLCVTFISDHFSKPVSFFFAIVILTDFSFIHWTLHYFVHYLPSIIHCPHTPLSKLFNKIVLFLLTHHSRKYFCKDNTYL